MHESSLLVILLLSISTNLDNFGIGVTYGVRRVHIPVVANLIIAVLNSSGNYLSMFLGERIYRIIDQDYSKYIGAGIIMCIGIFTIIQEIIARRRRIMDRDNCSVDLCEWNNKSVVGKIMMIVNNPIVADVDSSGSIDIKESFLLGLALTFTNIAGGVGAGMMGLSPLLTTAGVFIFSIAMILSGLKIGRYWLARLFGGLTGPIGGLFLILISIYELVS